MHKHNPKINIQHTNNQIVLYHYTPPWTSARIESPLLV